MKEAYAPHQKLVDGLPLVDRERGSDVEAGHDEDNQDGSHRPVIDPERHGPLINSLCPFHASLLLGTLSHPELTNLL